MKYNLQENIICDTTAWPRAALSIRPQRPEAMSTAIMEGQLLRLLSDDAPLAQRGCEARRKDSGGIVVLCGGQARGVWAWDGSRFEFRAHTQAKVTMRVETPVEALLTTLAVVCPRP